MKVWNCGPEKNVVCPQLKRDGEMVRFSLLVKPVLMRVLIPVFILVFLVDSIFLPGSARSDDGRDVIILTAAFPDFSAQPNQIAIASGADAELLHFPGTNTIVFESGPAGFQLFRSGSVVTFQGSDGTICRIPATASVQTIRFRDGQDLYLRIEDARVRLAGLTVTAEKADIPVVSTELIQPEARRIRRIQLGIQRHCFDLVSAGRS